MRYSIILAAGKGTRMKSKEEDSKVAFPILGRSLVEYVLDSVDCLNVNKKVVVVGFGGNTTSKLVGDRAEIVWQKEQKGTGHAVLQAKELLERLEGDTIILYGDTPLLTKETLINLFNRHTSHGNDVTVLTAFLETPEGYGRVIRDHKTQQVLAIKEDRDCSLDEKFISETDAGVYVFNNKVLFEALKDIEENKPEEINISEAITLISKRGGKVDSYVSQDQTETFSVTNRVQLSYAAKILRKRINKELMQSGVSMEDPETTYISPGVKIGQDTVIFPNSFILGNSSIGERNTIGPNAYLKDVVIGNNNRIRSSWVYNCEIGDDQEIHSYQVIENKKIK